MNQSTRTQPTPAQGETRSEGIVASDETAPALARLETLFRKCRGRPASEALLQGLRDYRCRGDGQ